MVSTVKGIYVEYLRYEFPRAILTMYHKLCGLEEQIFIPSHFWKLEAKIKVLAGLSPHVGSEGQCVSCLSLRF